METNSLPLNPDQICPGCKLSAVSDQGGLVVAFGQSLFHVDCFKCAKCANKVTADTNLLLLSDGSPICADCSYSCNVCHLPILDEAIMSGEDSYHAHCFRCKVCKNRIDELVYAKTSQGMYCMDCHNERMIKMRKHTQRKREKEKAAAAAAAAASANSSQSSRELPSTPSKNLVFTVAPPADEQPSERAPVFHPPPRTSSVDHHQTPQPRPPPLNRNHSYPIPDSEIPSSDQLSVTSKRDKRRSINPGLSLHLSEPISGRSSPTLTPESIKLASSPSPTPPAQNGVDSPLRDYFSTSRPISNGSLHSQRLRKVSAGADDQTIVIRPSSPNINRPGSSSTLSIDHPRTPRSPSPASRSRPMSRADVPQSVESATDESDDDDQHGIINHYRDSSEDSIPPLPPSKDRAPPPPPITLPSDSENERLDSSALSTTALESDASESSPVERRTSRATFIAPALPPIRFSLNTADFSDLFSSVGGHSLKNLETLANATDKQEHKPKRIDEETDVPNTPPPTAASVNGHSADDYESGKLDRSTSVKSLRTLGREAEATSRQVTRGRAASDSRTGSSDDLVTPIAQITLTPPVNGTTKAAKTDTSPDLVFSRLQEVMRDAKERGAQQLKLDRGFVEAIVEAMAVRKVETSELRGSLDGMKRASRQYIEGLTVAQTEYDRELKARRDAEAEVTRLRVLLSGQAARLTALNGDSKKQELRQQMTKDLNDNLSGLERDLSKLKAQRDMALVEVEELAASKSSAPEGAANLNRSITKRLDTLKTQYQRDLVPLVQQREILAREVMELKASRDAFLEETTVLNARNEELAQLSTQYQRRMAMAGQQSDSKNTPVVVIESERKSEDRGRTQAFPTQPTANHLNATPYSISSNPSTSTLGSDETDRYQKLPKIPEVEIITPSKGRLLKWGVSKAKDLAVSSSPSGKNGSTVHNFQPLSLLRFTRCDHCGDKMWGSQLRCTGCNISVHTRCVSHVHVGCSQQMSKTEQDEPQALPPSMFGRDLVEQVRADAKGGSRKVPVIVEKCIGAVETLAMDYEGIYRKTGGSGQSRTITQLFERGDYDSFDLCDQDRFNDICSVTSVLKTYLRSLPIPLLTHELHDQFTTAVQVRDPALKSSSVQELVNKLPPEHYCTLRLLMLHLNRIMEQSEINLMNARNLGVVFGPTLMRSPIAGAEFSDMAGKALTVEWLVENAPQAFNPSKYPH